MQSSDLVLEHSAHTDNVNIDVTEQTSSVESAQHSLVHSLVHILVILVLLGSCYRLMLVLALVSVMLIKTLISRHVHVLAMYVATCYSLLLVTYTRASRLFIPAWFQLFLRPIGTRALKCPTRHRLIAQLTSHT